MHMGIDEARKNTAAVQHDALVIAGRHHLLLADPGNNTILYDHAVCIRIAVISGKDLSADILRVGVVDPFSQTPLCLR